MVIARTATQCGGAARNPGFRNYPMAEMKVRSEIAGSVWKIEVAVGD